MVGTGIGRRGGARARGWQREMRIRPHEPPAPHQIRATVAALMLSGYEHDVFISYNRGGAIEKWVELYFAPVLRDRLVSVLPATPAVFFDKTIKSGQKWPAVLQRALAGSRILIAVLDAPYFSSEWCLAELDTMLAREKQLGLSCRAQTDGLIYPVVVGDGDHFRADMAAIQRRDMKTLTHTTEAFRGSPKYIAFEADMMALTDELAKMVSRAPPFDPKWPRLTNPQPGPDPAAAMTPPRFA